MPRGRGYRRMVACVRYRHVLIAAGGMATVDGGGSVRMPDPPGLKSVARWPR
jgi:hypothetical protein